MPNDTLENSSVDAPEALSIILHRYYKDDKEAREWKTFQTAKTLEVSLSITPGQDKVFSSCPH